jgi:hypothetical protein
MCVRTPFVQIYVESHLCNSGTKFYGELTEQITKVRPVPLLSQ